MRQIKKTTPVSPSQTDALPRVSQDLICSPQLTHNASSSPPAQRGCLAWLSPPNPAWTSPLLSIPFISPHRIQYKFTDHWECLLFYGGLDGHPVLEGAYNMCFGIQFVTLYIYTSLLRIGYIRTLTRTIGSCCGLHHYLEDHHRPM